MIRRVVAWFTAMACGMGLTEAASLTVSWDPYTPSTGIDIRVERDSGSGFGFLAATPATNSSLADPSVVNGIQYCYRTQALRLADNITSVYSNIACGMPGPTNLALTPGTGTAIVTITQPTEGASLPPGPILIKGTTPLGMASILVRLDNVGATPIWTKATGAWEVTRTITQLGTHVVGVTVWSPAGQVTSTYVTFRVQ